MNFDSQICTTEEQSKRLLALGLKKETADCRICPLIVNPNQYLIMDMGIQPLDKDETPAWSLHRLIEMLGLSKMIFNIDLYDSPYEEIIRRIDIFINAGEFNKEYLEE